MLKRERAAYFRRTKGHYVQEMPCIAPGRLEGYNGHTNSALWWTCPAEPAAMVASGRKKARDKWSMGLFGRAQRVPSPWGQSLPPCFKFIHPLYSSLLFPYFLAPMAVLICGPLVSSAWFKPCNCCLVWDLRLLGKGQRGFIGKRKSLKCIS